MSLAPESRDNRQSSRCFSVRLFAVIAGAVAVVWSTGLVVDGWKAKHAPVPPVRTVAATGTAKQRVQADRVTWTATVSARGRDRTAALRQLPAAARAVRDFLAARDIHPDEMTIFPAGSEEQYDTVTRRGADGYDEQHERATGFLASQVIQLRSEDVARALRALRELASAEDLDVQVAEPVCSSSGIEAIQDELLKHAREDVRKRAEAAVRAIGGAKLGPVTATDLGSVHAAESGLVACEQGAEWIAVVNTTFALE